MYISKIKVGIYICTQILNCLNILKVLRDNAHNVILLVMNDLSIQSHSETFTLPA